MTDRSRRPLPRPGLASGFLNLLAVLAGSGFLAACAAEPPPAVRPGPSHDLFVAGYHPWWAGEADGAYPMDWLDQLFFFEVEAGANGELLDRRGWPGEWDRLRRRAAEAGVQVVPTLTMHQAGAFEAVFQDPEATGRLVEATLGLLREDPAVRGVHLDIEIFEPVSVAARDGYTAFAAALSRRMEAMDPGLGLSIFLPAFDDADAYNERALAEVADYVVVQGYDFHHRGDATAGPVGALRGWGRLNWSAVADRLKGLGVPEERVLMAAPLYGYQWPTESDLPGAATRDGARAMPLAAPPNVLPDAPRARDQARIHGLRRDSESGSPWFAFQDSTGGWVQGWFDDERSLADKIRFVRERGLGGIAFFPLTYGDRALWDALAPLLGAR